MMELPNLHTIPQYMPFNILLVDDDKDDCFFFKDALNDISIPVNFDSVDGEGLKKYLSKNIRKIPDILFLDLNMPSKNGFECLSDLKSNKKIQHIPVIIYSTSFHETVADELYKNGAHYYLRKSDLGDLKKILFEVLVMMSEKRSTDREKVLDRPPRNKFVLNF